MTREEIIKDLKERGFTNVETMDTVKNGVTFTGILINDGEMISPIIYTEKIIKKAEEEGMSVEEVAEQILEIYRESKKNKRFDIEKFMDKNWVLNHLDIALQRKSDQELIKKVVEEIPDVEAYLYISDQIEETGSYEIKLKKEHLKYIGLSEKEAWEKAYMNVCESTEIVSMKKIIMEMMGLEYREEDDDEMMYVISNKRRIKGASCVLNKEKLKEWAKEKKTNVIYVLPSSIHESILVPKKENDGFDLEGLSAMVREVNQNEVLEEEQLCDVAIKLVFD